MKISTDKFVIALVVQKMKITSGQSNFQKIVSLKPVYFQKMLSFQVVTNTI